MCGIFGYIGVKTNIQRVLIDGIKKLEYRGYDSSGIAYGGEKIKIVKTIGKVEKLEQLISDEDGHIGIAHTRWATHGAVNVINSHPHHVGEVTIVHNGIIENYNELKEFLERQGYSFISQTDTEVICALLDWIKKTKKKDNIQVIHDFIDFVEGSYALGIIFDDDLNNLYATCKDSPLVVGLSEKGNMLASDIIAFQNLTKKYMLIGNKEIVKLTKDNACVYDYTLKNVVKEQLPVIYNEDRIKKGNYQHYMLKEIEEEPYVLSDIISDMIDNKSLLVNKMPNLTKYDKIHIVACGSAMHAGLIGKYLFETYSNIMTIVDVASEYRYRNNLFDEKTLVIIVSQSGETADSIAALRKAKTNHIDTLAIVNVITSTIAREADYTLFTKAGPEVAVATTKAYLAQVTMFLLLNLKLMLERRITNQSILEKKIENLNKSPEYVEKMLEKKEIYQDIAKQIVNEKDIFFMGRGRDYYLCLEGSLKLKEITYIHSEAYQAGELKHGTISLIEKHTKVIVIMTDKNLAPKTISNIKEVVARGAEVILITTQELDRNYDFVTKKVVIPSVDDYLVPLLAIVPLQLIAYYVGLFRGCDIDKPRNLAKSVTVE